MHRRLHHLGTIGCLASVLALFDPQMAQGQRVRTYESEIRHPIVELSGPNDVIGPVTGSESYYEPLRIDIGTNVALPHDVAFYGVTAIAIQEKSDEPCKIELYGRLLDPEGSQADILVGKGTLFGCDEERASSWRAATVAVQPHTFLRSVQACFQKPPFSHMKIKGLTVSSGVVLDDGGIVPLPTMPCFDQKTPHCFARSHCNNWAAISVCPVEQIVTGVMLYHYAEDDHPPRALSAIRSLCRSIRIGAG